MKIQESWNKEYKFLSMCMSEIFFQDFVHEQLQNNISINLFIKLWLCNIFLSTCK